MQKEQLHPTTIVISASCYNNNGNLHFWSQGLFIQTEVNAYADFFCDCEEVISFLTKKKKSIAQNSAGN